jgi:hypothetical protein
MSQVVSLSIIVLLILYLWDLNNKQRKKKGDDLFPNLQGLPDFNSGSIEFRLEDGDGTLSVFGTEESLLDLSERIINLVRTSHSRNIHTEHIHLIREDCLTDNSLDNVTIVIVRRNMN